MVRPSVSAFVQLLQQIQQDQSCDAQQLLQRDQKIASCLDNTNDVSRLLSWLEQIALASNKPLAGLFSLNTLRIIALFIGITSMAGYLLSHSQTAINILTFLLVFVALQLLTLALSLYGCMRQRGLNLGLNPFSFIWLKQWQNHALAPLINSPELAELRKWWILQWGQVFAVWFNLGLILAFIIQLAVQDYYFSWSSSFDVSSEFLSKLTQLLSLPWQTLLPQGVPSFELLEQSKLLHPLKPNELSSSQQAQPWWPFLALCLLFYGLMPRIILNFFCRYKQAKNLELSFLNYPGVSNILQRLTPAMVKTNSAEAARPNSSTSPPTVTMQSQALTNSATLKAFEVIINWCDCNNNIASNLSDTNTTFHAAGSGALDTDLKIASAIGKNQSCAILLKSWEPPLAELADFINQINSQSISLLLQPLKQQVRSRDQQEWQRFSQTLSIIRIISLNHPGQPQ